MNLYELTFTSYLYGLFADFDKAYRGFKKNVNNDINLYEPSHREFLLKWLNYWGCRQFYTKYHPKASEELLNWYKKYNKFLPSKEVYIWELKEQDFKSIQTTYDNLANKIASFKPLKKGGQTFNSFGDTGASKILFALRPKSLIPWDNEMRNEFKKVYSISIYSDYLKIVIGEIKDLGRSCREQNINLIDLPNILNKGDMTILKLIDEYHWIKITHKFDPPKKETLQKWIKWNK